MKYELYIKNKDYKTEKNYLYNARCIIYKKLAEKLELLKQKPIGI